MKFLNVNEILDTIDKQFGYDFGGKERDDHLISKKTWNKYVREFFEEKIYETEYMSSYENKIIGGNRYTKYREDFVTEVIGFRKDQIIKQFNSNRKTTVDHDTIKAFETIASALGLKVEEDIYNKRIPITQYKKKQEERYPIMTKEDVENVREQLLHIVINQLIDMEKLKYDVSQYLVSGSLEYGFANPLEMVGDKDSYPLGFRIDAKNYLKESIRNELINHCK
ncbi:MULTISPECIES: hypothetical protein [Bacillus]|uniref:hypothetical protein n=1 Tax=Bacillus TaxID=1386 RepID=UPI0012FC1253|nr:MULTISPECIES: hypothetical protein [Bacillus]MCY7580642.1 hypothetical protein [Bacillus altitudinis]MCY7595892.1 hypothetical protein [Bacillus altitudinis]QGX63956.1 hypothetical protein GPA07_00130 [Bacillus sp. ms-22]